MSWTTAARVVATGTCVFLTPFCIAAYFDPMSWLNVSSVGLVPSDTDPLTGLSNLRGSVGGLRLGIIATAAIGTWQRRSDLCLAGAIVVAAVAAGRFLSLALDGLESASFATATSEVVITTALAHLSHVYRAASARS